MNYDIVVDMSVDIDKDFLENNDLKFIPMEYTVGEETHYCTHLEDDEMMHHYYDLLRDKKETRTSQITPYHYEEFFQKYVDEKKPVLYISLSSGLSNTYDSARLAVENLKDDAENPEDVQIQVVDSLGATVGMGLLVEMAFRKREEGLSLEENADLLRGLAKKICYWFKVEDLMYLMRGGRVSATTAMIGTALNIKPILTINGQGKLENIAKKRGDKQAMKYLISQFEENYDPSVCDTVYICSADCQAGADKLKSAILESHPELKIKTTMLSPIIGAHTGPDLIAVVHFGKTER